MGGGGKKKYGQVENSFGTSVNPVEYNHEATGDSLKRAPAACPVGGPSKGPTKTADWGLGGSSHPTGARSSGRGCSLS